MHMRGITLLEILIVIAILGLLSTVGFEVIRNFSKTISLTSSVEDGRSLLLEARTKTLSSQGEMQYGVHFATTSMVLFAGTSFPSATSTEKTATLGSPAIISGIVLLGGGDDVVFNRLTGRTAESGIVVFQYVSETGTTSRTLRIGETGIISIE